eukprot:g31877.t1
MKELVIDFRKPGGGHAPICNNGAEVELVEILGVMITNNLSWSIHVDEMVKKVQQCLYFLRRLRKFGMSAGTLTNFQRGTIESILSRCIIALYGNCSAHDHKKLQSSSVTFYSLLCSVTLMHFAWYDLPALHTKQNLSLYL